MLRALILSASLVVCAHCTAQEASVERLLSQSEATIQLQIDRIQNSLNQPGVDPGSNLAIIQEIQALKESVADKGEIVKQVAIFAADADGDEQRPLMSAMILQLLDLPPKIVIRVLAPHLSADDQNLRSFVRDWFQAHDNAAPSGRAASELQPINYEDYKNYVRGLLTTKQEIPSAFVEYIFERSPNRALLIFYSAQRAKEPDILLAEHTIGNAIWLKQNKFSERFEKSLPEANGELAKLAKHKEWWVRLYVAYIMRQHPELRQADVWKQFGADTSKLVSTAATVTDN
jgi:hypothetical protein